MITNLSFAKVDDNSNFSAKPSLNFLTITDIHLNHNSGHKMQLAPHKNDIRNDLDLNTYLSFLKLIKQNINHNRISKPNFILILGDLPGHKRYKNSVISNETIVFKTLAQTFNNTPIIYVFGNNDAPQKNYAEFEYKNRLISKLPAKSEVQGDSKRRTTVRAKSQGDSSTKVTQQFASTVEFRKKSNVISPFTIATDTKQWQNGFLSTGTICKSKLYPCLQEQNSNAGYFLIKINSQLNLIGLNSVLFSINNNFKQQSAEELAWLDSKLAAAFRNKQQTIIAMHIPPGYNIYNNQAFWRKAEFAEFIKIMQKYPKNVIGILTAHTHQEEIKIIPTNHTKLGVYATPALSTAYGNTPMIKSYFLKKTHKNWHINNYITYKFAENNHLTLSKLYDFQGYYCKIKTSDINQCLKNVNIDKISKYMSGENPNHFPIIKAPDKFIAKSEF